MFNTLYNMLAFAAVILGQTELLELYSEGQTVHMHGVYGTIMNLLLCFAILCQ